ncbi:MAG: hypothetical protein ABUK01_11630 [Leptospirales bacterium]
MKPNFSTGNKENELEKKILEVLETELFAYNEGCVGTGCQFLVMGKAKASKVIAGLFEEKSPDSVV